MPISLNLQRATDTRKPSLQRVAGISAVYDKNETKTLSPAIHNSSPLEPGPLRAALHSQSGAGRGRRHGADALDCSGEAKFLGIGHVSSDDINETGSDNVKKCEIHCLTRDTVYQYNKKESVVRCGPGSMYACIQLLVSYYAVSRYISKY